VFGCCIGSFLNVVIYRFPRNESIIYPRSKCTICKKKIKWFDNIPVFSWILLNGRCRNCNKKISITYPLVEIATGILFILNTYAMPTFYEDLPSILIKLYGSIFSIILLILSIFDFKFFWLPQAITFSGLFLGFICSLIADYLTNLSEFYYLLNSIKASIIGFLVFFILSRFGRAIYGKPILGDGDIKLSALIGSWLGIQGLFISWWIAFNTAGIFVIAGLLLKKINRTQKIPFGIFLALGAFSVWYFGNEKLSEFILLKKII